MIEDEEDIIRFQKAKESGQDSSTLQVGSDAVSKLDIIKVKRIVKGIAGS